MKFSKEFRIITLIAFFSVVSAFTIPRNVELGKEPRSLHRSIKPKISFVEYKKYALLTSSKQALQENDSSEIASERSPFTRAIDMVKSDTSRAFAFSAWMVLCGAILGPFLDSYHSAFGVLEYDTPLKLPAIGLTTAWWVPELFGLAGFIIGWLYILLDEVFANPQKEHPMKVSPPLILVCISFFTLQYWLSGVLYDASFDRTMILCIMSILSGIGYMGFDASIAGFIASLATAVGGPLIEVGLISVLSGHGSGYHYTDPGETGFFPLWISPIYFLGGPAVGNLARGIWTQLSKEKTLLPQDNNLDRSLENFVNASGSIEDDAQPRCKTCNDTRAVGCPNCDAQGYYVSYGRRIKCNCCNGKGLVICRDCFSQYDDDPYDIDGIRDIMSRIPD